MALIAHLAFPRRREIFRFGANWRPISVNTDNRRVARKTCTQTAPACSLTNASCSPATASCSPTNASCSQTMASCGPAIAGCRLATATCSLATATCSLATLTCSFATGAGGRTLTACGRAIVSYCRTTGGCSLTIDACSVADDPRGQSIWSAVTCHRFILPSEKRADESAHSIFLDQDSFSGLISSRLANESRHQENQYGYPRH